MESLDLSQNDAQSRNKMEQGATG